jgi:hypothetical protein
MMQITLEDYRSTLVGKILLADSQEEVRLFIDAAMKGLKERKVNGHIVARFLDKITHDLAQFDPIHKNPEQWSNIKMARIHFNRLRQTFEITNQPKNS